MKQVKNIFRLAIAHYTFYAECAVLQFYMRDIKVGMKLYWWRGHWKFAWGPNNLKLRHCMGVAPNI